MDNKISMRELRSSAKENGFCCYWKSKKDELIKGIDSFKKTDKVPLKFKPKRKISETCEDNVECRSKKCVDQKCIGSKKNVSFSKKLVIGKESVSKNRSRSRKANDNDEEFKELIKNAPRKRRSEKSKSRKANDNDEEFKELIKNAPRKRRSDTSKTSKTSKTPKTSDVNKTRTTSSFEKDGKKCKSVCITRCK
jgi:hypothetical protein